MIDQSTELEGRRVLVVEDNYLLAEDVARALRNHGAEVIGPIPTVKKALPLILEQSRVDVAVLDIDVNGTSIIPVAKALQERGLPFVFATALDPSAIPPGFQNVPCWEKPFEPDALARSLSTIC